MVSIPLWFDSNGFCTTGIEFGSTSFQFHSGSIQTNLLHKIAKPPCIVSIPLWFDSNMCIVFFFLSLRVLFQFHSGSIQTANLLITSLARNSCFNSTLVRFKPTAPARRSLSPRVSIPLWFDSNLAKAQSTAMTAASFNSTLVRFKPIGLTTKYTSEFVSIPLWFDSNRSACSYRVCLRVSFQFHSGSIQTTPSTSYVFLCSLFQFHSGSIQTWKRGWLRSFGEHVSIPLWFDSNPAVSEPYLAVYSGFNSTLVRFKLRA